jgi:uncharacterized protein YndB with AHSA1/START domain
MSSRVLVAVRVAAPADVVFQAFTEEIGDWWEPNGLFQFDQRRTGTLAFESGPDGRLVERYDDGEVFEIGRVRAWEPPSYLAFGWRQASFDAGQDTEVRVRFEPVDGATRVTVEHWGWDAIPEQHAARHGFPLLPFQQREAEWWRRMLRGRAFASRSEPDR